MTRAEEYMLEEPKLKYMIARFDDGHTLTYATLFDCSDIQKDNIRTKHGNFKLYCFNPALT